MSLVSNRCPHSITWDIAIKVLLTWVLGTTYLLNEIHIYTKLFQNAFIDSKLWAGHDNSMYLCKKTFRGHIWPWPLSYRPGSWAWYIITRRYIFIPSTCNLTIFFLNYKVMVWTQRFNALLIKYSLKAICDLELCVTDLGLGCNTMFQWDSHLYQVNLKSNYKWQKYDPDTTIKWMHF